MSKSHKYIEANTELIENWVTWLDAETRMHVMSDWEKTNKRELMHFLAGLIEEKKDEPHR
jgi:hypothetical protein